MAFPKLLAHCRQHQSLPLRARRTVSFRTICTDQDLLSKELLYYHDIADSAHDILRHPARNDPITNSTNHATAYSSVDWSHPELNEWQKIDEYLDRMDGLIAQDHGGLISLCTLTRISQSANNLG